MIFQRETIGNPLFLFIKVGYVKIFFIIIFSFNILAVIYSQQFEQTLTKQTVERIIEHNLDIFKLLYSNNIDHSFQFLRDFVIYERPSPEWPDVDTIKNYYKEAINMKIPKKVNDFFIINKFEENAFIQYITCCFILEIIRVEKFYFDKIKNTDNYIDYKIIIDKLMQIEGLFNLHDLILIYRYYDQFLQFTLGDYRNDTQR